MSPFKTTFTLLNLSKLGFYSWKCRGTAMEATEEQQFHNQNQSPPDHIEELGSVSQSSLSSSFDPNLRNPDENDDADDEIAMRIICEELQNLVLDQALLNEEREKEDEEEENGNTRGNEPVNDDGSVQIISEELRNLVLDQALLNKESETEDLYHEESQNGKIKENELVNDYGWGDYGGDNYDYEGDRYGGGNTSENENGYDEGFSKEGGFNDENSIMRKFNHPLRPDAQDCPYFMKTGMCKFGSNCKYNHPYRKKNQDFPSPLQHGTKERGKQKEENEERPGQIECKYYLTSGGCKYGKACKFAHGRDKSSVSPIAEFNFLGLPIRPGERECPYYMRTGSCKYGSNCRFHHPDPTDVAGDNPSSGFKNARGIPVRAASNPAVSSWSPPRRSSDSAPYVPTMYPPTQGIASPNSEWDGYQAPVYPTSEKRLPTLPAIAMSNPANKNNFYPRPQQPLLPVGEYPERPGQPECSYFIKTGDCKYKSSCRFHHPKSCISKASILNDKGLPLRPDQNVCSYYSRYGICKFGPGCRFDHPENYGSSASPFESGFDQHQQSQMDLGWGGGQEPEVDH